MTTTKKLVIAVVALSIALVGVVGGTLAWLVSTTAEVKNTFTVGEIEITLDEADVDESKTNKTTEGRDMANSYKLVPHGTYAKDPTVHVKANEKCYVFVKVQNDLATLNLEAPGNTTIAAQIDANGWIELEAGVYYKVFDPQTAGSSTDLVVFQSFTIADSVDKAALANVDSTTVVTVTAYAIQYLGFEGNPADAWNTVSTAANG